MFKETKKSEGKGEPKTRTRLPTHEAMEMPARFSDESAPTIEYVHSTPVMAAVSSSRRAMPAPGSVADSCSGWLAADDPQLPAAGTARI